MNISTLTLSATLGVVLGLAACQSMGDSPIEIENLDLERQSTSPQLAVSNFHAQIEAAELRVERIPSDVSARERLVGLLLARTQYLGSFDDFDQAFDVVEDALEMGLAPARTALLHAHLLSAVHRFDEALAELERAEVLGARDTQAFRETISLAQGRDPSAIVLARVAVTEAAPSYASWTKLAAALAADERYTEADSAFYKALTSYHDVSPFPMAWIAFQRGVMWGERAGESKLALSLYEVSVKRLPQYVVGNVHLSELEFSAGDVDAAVARLEAIVDETDDPEPASRLAQYLAEQDPQRAQAYAEQALEGYDEYLARYPLAFADHASEFFMGAGNDPLRALELALLNLDNRKTARAYSLAITAAQATNNDALACQLLQEQGEDC